MSHTFDVASPTAERRDGAMRIVHRYVLISAAAGVVTVPGLDVVLLGGVHIALIRDITEYYGEEFAEHGARNILIAIAAGLLPGAIGSVLGRKALNALPFISPGLGLLTLSASSAALSYAIGVGFTRHYEKGGTLASFDVKNLHRPLAWPAA